MPGNRAWLSFGITVCLFGVLASGCRDDQSIIGLGGAEPVSEPVMVEEITLWHTYSDIEALKFKKEVLPAFEKDHPEIRVNSMRKPYESMKGGLISHATSKSGPDVVRMDMVWIPEFAKLGLIEPVDEYPEFLQVRGKLFTAALETSKYDGRYYGIPLNLNTKAAIYNRYLLKKAGYDHPPATMDGLIELMRKTGGKMGLMGYHPWAVLPYFMGLGGQFTDASYTKASGYLNSEASVLAVATLKNLMEQGILDIDSITGKRDRWQSIVEGSLMMTDDGPWFYSILSQLDQHNLNMLNEKTVATPFPHNPGSKGAIIGGESLVVIKGSKHRQASLTFMKWMAGVTGQRLMFETGLMPTNMEAARDPKALSNPAIRPFVDSLSDSFLRPPVPNWNKIDNEFAASFEQMLNGQIPVQSGLATLAMRIDHLLSPAST